MGARGVDESAFKLPSSWEGPVGTAKVANRTREIRPCGMTRGACGNVDQGGTRHPPRVSKERVLETLHLKLCAPQFYPNHRLSPTVVALRRRLSNRSCMPLAPMTGARGFFCVWWATAADMT